MGKYRYGRVYGTVGMGGGGTEGGMNEKVERNHQECEPLANFLAKLFYIRALVPYEICTPVFVWPILGRRLAKC